MEIDKRLCILTATRMMLSNPTQWLGGPWKFVLQPEISEKYRTFVRQYDPTGV